MPYQIQGNSGKVYDFDDSVPLEKAAEYIHFKEPPKTSTDLPGMGLGLAKGNWTGAAAGLAQAYGDIAPDFLGAQTALADAARLREQARQEREEALGGATSFQRDIAGGIASAIQNIPTLGLGVGRGLIGLAGGMGAKEAAIAGGEAALRGMVGPEVLGEYGEQRAAGMGGVRSALHAGIHGAAEYIPERMAFAPLVDLLSLGKGPTLRAVGAFLGKDLVGEEATTVMEFVNQKVSRRPDATFGDLLEEMKSTAVSTLVSGPLQAGLGAGVTAAAMPIAQKIAPEEFTPARIPDSSRYLTPSADTFTQTTREGEFDVPARILQNALNTELDRIVTDPNYLPDEASVSRVASLRNALEKVEENTLVDVSTDESLQDYLYNYTSRRLLDVIQSGDDLSTSDVMLALVYQRLRGEQQERITGDAPYIGPTDIAQTQGIVDKEIEDAVKGHYQSGLTDVYSHLNHFKDWVSKDYAVADNSPNGAQFARQSVDTIIDKIQPGQVLLAVGHGKKYHKVDKMLPIARQVQDWVTTFMPNMKVILSDVTTTGYHGVMRGGSDSFFAMEVDPFRSSQDVVFTLSHEFGHGLVYSKFMHAPKEVQAAITRDYLNALQSLKGTTASEFAAANLRPAAMENVQGVQDVAWKRAQSGSFAAYETKYILSFDEWLADQSARYFKNRSMYTGEVKSWWDSVIAALERFFSKFSAKYTPTESFANWLDGLVVQTKWEQAKAEGWKRSRLKRELSALGIPDATMQLAMAGGTQVPAPTTEGISVTELDSTAEEIVLMATAHSRYTTQFVNALPQKPTLTRKEAMGLLARLPLPKAEKELVQEVLNQPQFVRERFAREWLVDEINRRVLSLVPKKYGDQNNIMVTWGVDTIGRPANAGKPFATVWRAPFELGVDPHFDDPYYFAHTRAFDFGSDARAVFEVQSNFFQGNKLSLTPEEEAQLREQERQYSELKRVIETKEGIAGLTNDNDKDKYDELITVFSRKTDVWNHVSVRLSEIRGKLERANSLNKKIQSDFADIWTRRIIREEVRKAAHEGKRTIRWSTADTMAKVEGWSSGLYNATQNMIRAKAQSEAAMTKYRKTNDPKDLASAQQWQSIVDNLQQEIEANREKPYGKNQPIWNRHKKSIEDYIRREYGGRDVTDDLGNTWVEMDVPISAATEEVEAFSLPLHVGLSQVAKTLGLKGTNYSTIPHKMAKINFALKTALGAFQLLKLNSHIPGATEYKQALRNSMQYKHEWLSVTDANLNELIDLPPDELAKLSNLMFEEAETAQGSNRSGFLSTSIPDPKNPNRVVFILDPAAKKRFGLSDKAAEMYSKVRTQYRAALDEMERVGISEIMAPEFDPAISITLREMLRRGAPTQDMLNFVSQVLSQTQNKPLAAQVQAKLDELQGEFSAMRAKAYMPFSRFGRETILVKDPATKGTLYFEAFETEKELREALPAIRQRFQGKAVSVTRLEDIPYMFQGVPQSFFRAVATKIGLAPGTPEYSAYLELIKDTTNAASFVRRMKRKQGVEGYSIDMLRGYADYFKRFGNYIARVKRSGELNYAMEVLGDYIKSLENDPRGVHDTRKLHELHEWLAEHKAYIDNPGNELAEVKSFVALWYFGGNISSAAMNLTQVPFVTLPYLSKRFGFGSALKELKRGYADMARMWKNQAVLSADEQAMWDHALASGFLDESFATVVAQLADGNAMSRVHPVGRWRRATNAFNHYAMWPFQKAEYINRGVTLLAAYRMNRKAGFTGPFDEAAFDAARGAVEDTQNEYAQEARPTFMRGNWSVVFQFMSYMQNMLFQMLKGDSSWKRLLLTQLFLAGALGAPFAEDIKNAVKFLMRGLGYDFDPEREARLLLEDMDINSDLILRGMTSNAFGFDLSQRISLGNVIPGMRAVGSNKKFNEAVADATGDIAGPGIGVFLNILRFLGQDDKFSLRSLEMIAPTGVRNAIKGVRSELEGGMRDMSGAVLHDPEWWEGIGMTLGFMPEQLSDAYTSRTLQQEAANYWTQRRANILREWGYVMTEKDGAREGLADMLERVREYNSSAPDAKLRISQETLRRSAKERAKANLRRELGLGSELMTENLSRAIAETFE